MTFKNWSTFLGMGDSFTLFLKWPLYDYEMDLLSNSSRALLISKPE